MGYKRLLIGFVILLALAMMMYCYLFYPQQSMPVGMLVEVTTPEPEIYRNDCLHPCIRYDSLIDMYHMAQSPYYGWNNLIENPIYYTSKSYMSWYKGIVMEDTPKSGYNSDPCILLRGDTILYTWRECGTPRCDLMGVVSATVGKVSVNGKWSDIQVYATNLSEKYDVQLCPIFINRFRRESAGNPSGDMFMYATWYQYYPERKGNGLAIWRGTNIVEPDFRLIDTLRLHTTYTVDKLAQLRLFNHIWYVPMPLKHDVWHFDLFEYKEKLYMVSVAEKGDNIMLSVSNDYQHFKTYRKPLVNNHYSENYTGYRQYFYKPTAFVKNDSLYMFYTANAKDYPNRNQLFVTIEKIEKIIK